MVSSTTGTPVWPLLKTVFSSILEVFLTCLAGFILARKGILDKKTQKANDAQQINHLNISLFTPCLLFSKVAFFLSPAKLRELWIIPLFFCAVTAVSMAVAWLLGWMFRLKRSQRNFAMAASMFMNSNSLPIALLQSLVVTVPGLTWGDDDNTDAMVGRALTYLVLCSTLGMIVRWSYGVRLLSQADTEGTEPQGLQDESTLLLDSEQTLVPELAQEQHPNLAEPEDYLNHQPLIPSIAVHTPGNQRSVFYSFPNTPSISPSELPPLTPDDGLTTDESDSETDDDLDFPHPLPRHTTVPSSTRTQAFFRRTKHRVLTTFRKLNSFMTAPLWAALLSLVVALIPALQHTLEVHMKPVKGAVSQAGNCSIPLTLVVLGAYFYRPSSETGSRETRWHRVRSQVSLVDSVREMFSLKNGRTSTRSPPLKKESSGEGKTVFVAIAARMVITPALFLPLMCLGAWLDLPTVFEDPVFVLALVLLCSSPPALTLAQITQAASGDAFERLISRTIFWSYCIITPPATIIYSVLAMIIAKL
ncbi:hypothetical protein HETIRDRAFT_56145 [Heterobasidion irregulare TC 32-1]|uniref:Auxin efflux carrier n=1 Tax=Heterobasidion irregulare (strain TC 32-1) TaxID=747525 RepID=W4JW95_HETIT|nr:uncharacterized protein HETIRDRAFT_56145 [Heterobasidion irregulare TC 32-1]ETW77828.1 hypothetical protein HETIRDRAFT_56145 [Heterobasidion irregulare TC 32-1]